MMSMIFIVVVAIALLAAACYGTSCSLRNGKKKLPKEISNFLNSQDKKATD